MKIVGGRVSDEIVEVIMAPFGDRFAVPMGKPKAGAGSFAEEERRVIRSGDGLRCDFCGHVFIPPPRAQLHFNSI